jgi:hypothetical protein
MACTLTVSAPALRVWCPQEELRTHFRNISAVMDCVGCEKCRLWGKLQTLGLGTALKVTRARCRDVG